MHSVSRFALHVLFGAGVPNSTVVLLRVPLIRAAWLLPAATDVQLEKLAVPLTSESAVDVQAPFERARDHYRGAMDALGLSPPWRPSWQRNAAGCFRWSIAAGRDGALPDTDWREASKSAFHCRLAMTPRGSAATLGASKESRIMSDSIRRHLEEQRKLQDLLDPSIKLKAMLEPSSALQHAMKADQRIVDLMKADQRIDDLVKANLRIADLLKTDLLERSAIGSVMPKGLVDFSSVTNGLAGHSAAFLANVSTKSVLTDWMGSSVDLGRSIRDLTTLRTDIDSVLGRNGVPEAYRLAMGISNRDTAADVRRSIEGLTSARAAYELAFRLPELGEVERLARGLGGHLGLASVAGIGSDLIEQAMGQMHSPWLHTAHSAVSASAFVDLMGIGRGIQLLRPFDDILSTSLRTTLGDWREELPQSIALADPILRADFYRDRGFDPAVVDFPAQAFEEGLQIAGFQIWHEIEIVDEADESSTHAAMAFRALRRLETAIRAFIVERFTAQFGDKWYRQRLPADVLQAWTDKKARDTTSTADLPLIEYADFSDYIKIIERKDNWVDVFQGVFTRKEDIQESFRRLGPIRIATMHARLVLKEDLLLMVSETARILKAINGASPLS
jgi:hypothetical protein